MKFVVLTLLILVAGVVILFEATPLSINVKISYPKDNHEVQQMNVAAKKVQPANPQLTYGTVPGSILSLSHEQRAAELKQIRDAGFTEVRVGFNWSIIEPVQGKYNWTDTDSWLTAIRDAGLKSIIEIDRVPPWNRPSACKSDPNCAPVDTKYFANFAAAAASRYKNQNVIAWEIWNEENSINFWKPIPNANQYAHLLAVTYTAIKKADPTATILLGGLSGDSIDNWGSAFVDPRTYLAQVYDANGKDSFDAVAYHPYIKGFGLPNKISVHNGWAKMATEENNIRSIMVENGDANKNVWITEFGVTTGGRGVAVTDPSQEAPKGADHASYEAQAQIAQAVIDDVQQYPWVKSFIWYSYKDDKTTNIPGAGYGLWQYNGQPKPALKVLQNAMQQIDKVISQ